MNNISFSKIVKEEIVSKQYENDRIIAVLSSFVRNNGTISIKEKVESIIIRIENPKIAKFMFSSIKKIFNITPSISILRRNNLKKNIVYMFSVQNDGFLDKLKINFFDTKIDKYFSSNKDLIGGYISGQFLSSGSVNSPRNSNYHLEFSFDDENYMKWFLHLINKIKHTAFTFKSIKRKNKYVLYLKRSDQIVDFLIYMGATNSCLYFEDIRVERDVHNNENRLMNLDTANYMKLIKKANEDIKIINALINKFGLAGLGDAKTIECIKLRIDKPDLSLAEIAVELSKKLNKEISKGYVNHVLRKLRNKFKESNIII